jgi:hypothetical protein
VTIPTKNIFIKRRRKICQEEMVLDQQEQDRELVREEVPDRDAEEVEELE